MLFRSDEFLKRFSLNDLDDLPDYESLADRIETIPIKEEDNSLFDMKSNENISVDIPEKEEIPEFLKDEQVEIIE